MGFTKERLRETNSTRRELWADIDIMVTGQYSVVGINRTHVAISNLSCLISSRALTHKVQAPSLSRSCAYLWEGCIAPYASHAS